MNPTMSTTEKHIDVPALEKEVVSEARSLFSHIAGVFDPVSAPLAATFDRFHDWKEYMGLNQPGTVENFTRDVTSA